MCALLLLASSCLDDDETGPYGGRFPDFVNETQEQERTKFESYKNGLKKEAYTEPAPDLLKTTLQANAEGQSLGATDTVLVSYKVSLLEAQDSVLRNSYQSSDELLSMPEIMNMASLVGGLNRALQSMKVGEKSRFVMPSWILFGKSSNPIGIPQYSSTVWDIQVHSKGDDQSYVEYEQRLLEAYFTKLENAKLLKEPAVLEFANTSNKRNSYYYFAVLKEGDPATVPDSNDVCSVNYNGSYHQGQVFDSSYRTVGRDTISRPQSFYLLHPKTNLLKGFQKAVQKIGVGGKVVVGLHSDLAYKNKFGERQNNRPVAGSTIFNYNPIFFEIDLVSASKRTVN